jgi:hypothetical protein
LNISKKLPSRGSSLPNSIAGSGLGLFGLR